MAFGEKLHSATSVPAHWELVQFGVLYTWLPACRNLMALSADCIQEKECLPLLGVI